MGADAAALEEYLNHMARQPNIDLALNILIRDRVIPLVHPDVVIERNCGNAPFGQLVGVAWQGKQAASLLRKPSGPAAVFFLEWLMVEGMEPLPDDLLEFF